MTRALIGKAPELSRLLGEAPIDLLDQSLRHVRFADLLAEAMAMVPVVGDEPVRQRAFVDMLKSLSSDRIKMIEAEARRLTTMADTAPDTMLRRLAEDRRFGATDGLKAQRDALARSLWAYLHSPPLFEAAERAMQVRVQRDHGRLYEAWSIDTSIAIAAASVDQAALVAEIDARLQSDGGCRIEAVDLPLDDGDSRDVLIAVIFGGPYSSQKTVRPDRSTEIVYFRPPEEMLLVYSRDRQCIEVCSREATERRIVATIFATVTLNHDVSNKPLTQKTYNLSQFRRSLRLEIPEDQTQRIRRACITEVQVALGNWSRKVSLSVAPDEDIDNIARGVFGSIKPRLGGGYVTRLRFHIEHVDDRGKTGTLRFDVLGRNKSTIQNERDPAKRVLGYSLLEAWGVLKRIRDLSPQQRQEALPQMLVLYDLAEDRISGQTLDELGIAATVLVHSGHLAARGWSDVILFADDELGDVFHDVERDSTDDQVTVNFGGSGSGQRIPAGDVVQYEIKVAHLRDELLTLLKPMDLKGRTRELAPHLHQLGSAQIGLASAPVYLARTLYDDKRLEAAERLIRSDSARVRGIVFVPQEVRFPYLGCHVVLSLKDHLDPATGQIDPQTVRVAYEGAIDAAARGAAVHFRKQSDDAAQITVPGQDPRIVTGAKKVKLFERLYMAHRDREGAVKLAALKDYADFAQLPQLFGSEWEQINPRYLHSPQRGYWAIPDEPISL